MPAGPEGEDSSPTNTLPVVANGNHSNGSDHPHHRHHERSTNATRDSSNIHHSSEATNGANGSAKSTSTHSDHPRRHKNKYNAVRKSIEPSNNAITNNLPPGFPFDPSGFFPPIPHFASTPWLPQAFNGVPVALPPGVSPNDVTRNGVLNTPSNRPSGKSITPADNPPRPLLPHDLYMSPMALGMGSLCGPSMVGDDMALRYNEYAQRAFEYIKAQQLLAAAASLPSLQPSSSPQQPPPVESPPTQGTFVGASSTSPSTVTSSSGRPPGSRKRSAASTDTNSGDYWERRRKNNEAAKKSRDARRAKEEILAARSEQLERENLLLKLELERLKQEVAQLRALVYGEQKQ